LPPAVILTSSAIQSGQGPTCTGKPRTPGQRVLQVVARTCFFGDFLVVEK
jgi:hypothetical protein